LTHTGLVDVTEDHSLLGPDVELIKPKDTKIGQELYHSFPVRDRHNHEISADYAFVLGMFVGDGSCGLYDCPSGKKATWAINNKNLELLKRCKTICENEHCGYTFVIMNTLESSGVYKLSSRGGSVIDLVKLYRELCYDGQSKKIPLGAFGSESFLEGLWASDGCRKDNEIGGCHRIDTKNQVSAQWYYMFLRDLGYNVSLNTRTDKPNIYRLTWSTEPYRKDPQRVKKLFVLHESWDGYVYDLETEAGTFQAGVGSMIVKNTDSVMIEFHTGLEGQAAIEESWRLGERASKECSALFKKPNELELEKVYCPYILYSKKRYAAKMFEKKGSDVVFKKIDVKGLQVVRRDSCPFVREVCSAILDEILNTMDPAKAIQFAKKSARLLLQGKVPIDKLVLSRQLGSDYKSDNLAHVAVRDRMRQRAPGSEPMQGDRVQYVITDRPGKMYEKAEDPVWVAEHKLKVDYKYYMKHQLENPVLELLQPLIGNVNIFDNQNLISTFYK
jgi:hypothetical protein